MKESIITRDGQSITRIELSDLGSLTQRDKDMIREAAARPVSYDDDCPPLSPAMREEAEKMIAARAKRA